MMGKIWNFLRTYRVHLGVTLLFLAAAALIPLSDVMTLRVAGREGFAFSLPRGCGSAAFVVANLAMGALLTRVTSDAVITISLTGFSSGPPIQLTVTLSDPSVFSFLP